MKWTVKQSILATLAYAEMFTYPLTQHELYFWLITDTVVSLQTVRSSIRNFTFHGEYIGIKKFSSHRRIRERREIASQHKWQQVKTIIPLLQWVPTIQLIGVSGGLSMNNADEMDDIDLFFIVLPNTLWISRLIVLMVLGFTGKLRRVGDKIQKDKWCANMFVTSESVMIPENEQDIYSAHEVLQLVPIFEREGIYRNFLDHNSWVRHYLANAWEGKKKMPLFYCKKTNVIVSFPVSLFLSFFQRIIVRLESPAKILQQLYMRNHRTREVISDSVLRFHPKDVRTTVEELYPKLLKKIKVPLDSRFLSPVQ